MISNIEIINITTIKKYKKSTNKLVFLADNSLYNITIEKIIKTSRLIELFHYLIS